MPHGRGDASSRRNGASPSPMTGNWASLRQGSVQLRIETQRRVGDVFVNMLHLNNPPSAIDQRACLCARSTALATILPPRGNRLAASEGGQRYRREVAALAIVPALLLRLPAACLLRPLLPILRLPPPLIVDPPLAVLRIPLPLGFGRLAPARILISQPEIVACHSAPFFAGSSLFRSCRDPTSNSVLHHGRRARSSRRCAASARCLCSYTDRIIAWWRRSISAWNTSSTYPSWRKWPSDSCPSRRRTCCPGARSIGGGSNVVGSGAWAHHNRALGTPSAPTEPVAA